MKKANSVIIAAALIITAFTLPDRTQINDRLIIEGIGIDGTDGNGYTVTVQALDTSAQSGNAGNEKTADLSKLYSVTGVTPGEALGRLPAVTGASPLYSQTRVLVLGRETAERSVSGALDFFIREYTARSDVLLAVSDTSAAELITADVGEGTSCARTIAAVMTSGKDTGMTSAVELYRFISLSENRNDCAYCQILGIQKDETKAAVVPCGTALFSDGKICGTVPAEDTPFFLLLTGESGKLSISQSTHAGIFTLEAVRTKRRIRTFTDKNTPLCSIICTAVCDITEFSPYSDKKLTSDDISALAEITADNLTKGCAKVLDAFYYSKRCDICRIADRMKLFHSAFYRSMYSDDNKKSPPANVDLTVKVKIRRTGREMIIGE